jgi:hypothetical protein
VCVTPGAAPPLNVDDGTMNAKPELPSGSVANGVLEPSA